MRSYSNFDKVSRLCMWSCFSCLVMIDSSVFSELKKLETLLSAILFLFCTLYNSLSSFSLVASLSSSSKTDAWAASFYLVRASTYSFICFLKTSMFWTRWDWLCESDVMPFTIESKELIGFGGNLFEKLLFCGWEKLTCMFNVMFFLSLEKSFLID